MRKMLAVGVMLAVGFALAIQLRARSPHKETSSTAQKGTDWHGSKVFLPEANGFVTSVHGHGKVCYFYTQYLNDNATPIGSPILLWCDSEAQ